MFFGGQSYVGASLKQKRNQVLHAGLTLTTLNPAYTPHELAHQVTLYPAPTKVYNFP